MLSANWQDFVVNIEKSQGIAVDMKNRTAEGCCAADCSEQFGSTYG
jgi:hypothetical protein